MGLLNGKSVIITGAGRGLGRAHALAVAAAGASVVVNDLGVTRDGSGRDRSPAAMVVDQITAAGGEAVADYSDITDLDEAAAMVNNTVARWGRLDAVVNNAGILRDRMLFNMSGSDWDEVIRVHLRGAFCLSREAVAYWRAESKQGRSTDGRIICTSSPSGLYGSIGQANYAAAKAGVVGFALTLSKELAGYGVTANVLSPGARTRMTEGLFPMDDEVGLWEPENVSPALVWLLSEESHGLNGEVLEVENGWLGFATPWRHGARIRREQSHWTVAEVCAAMPDLRNQQDALNAEALRTP